VEWLRRQLGANVEWFPYYLHPEYPPDGIPRATLVERYGDHFAAVVQSMAAEAGLPFNPHPERIPNTRTALELTEWARAQSPEAHERLHDRLMNAYWSEGRDITGWAQSHGISAIPAFVFDQRVLVSGAMPTDLLERAARQAQEVRAAEG
jgi:predicted DsbA family dithiol-disulfide isomerase